MGLAVFIHINNFFIGIHPKHCMSWIAIMATNFTCLFTSWDGLLVTYFLWKFYSKNLSLFDSNDSNNYLVIFADFKSQVTCVAQDVITLKNTKHIKSNPLLIRKLHSWPNYWKSDEKDRHIYVNDDDYWHWFYSFI